MLRYRTRWWIVGGLVMALFMAVCFFTWPSQLLQLPLVVHEQPQAADVIIVLGAGTRRHGEPMPPQAKERVQHSMKLIAEGYAPSMIVAGGVSKHSGYIEAELMRNYALSQGLSEEKIIAENQSINTLENAVNSLEIMKQNNWHSALVVTSPYHTWRACTIFRKLKASVRCISAPLNIIPTNTVYERLTDLRSIIREYGAIIHNILHGRI